MEFKGFTELTAEQAMDVNGGFSITVGGTDLGVVFTAFFDAISSAFSAFRDSVATPRDSLVSAVNTALQSVWDSIKGININIG